MPQCRAGGTIFKVKLFNQSDYFSLNVKEKKLEYILFLSYNGSFKFLKIINIFSLRHFWDYFKVISSRLDDICQTFKLI